MVPRLFTDEFRDVLLPVVRFLWLRTVTPAGREVDEL
jgi:hypothetical protein